MGRIFTVDFHFQEKSYPALVKITAGQTDFSISIHVPDTDLHHLLPDGVFVYTNKEGFSVASGTNGKTLELIESMVNAVEAHLQV